MFLNQRHNDGGEGLGIWTGNQLVIGHTQPLTQGTTEVDTHKLEHYEVCHCVSTTLTVGWFMQWIWAPGKLLVHQNRSKLLDFIEQWRQNILFFFPGLKLLRDDPSGPTTRLSVKQKQRAASSNGTLALQFGHCWPLRCIPMTGWMEVVLFFIYYLEP